MPYWTFPSDFRCKNSSRYHHRSILIFGGIFIGLDSEWIFQLLFSNTAQIWLFFLYDLFLFCLSLQLKTDYNEMTDHIYVLCKGGNFNTLSCVSKTYFPHWILEMDNAFLKNIHPTVTQSILFHFPSQWFLWHLEKVDISALDFKCASTKFICILYTCIKTELAFF